MNSVTRVQIGNRSYYADGSIEDNGNRWTHLAPLDEDIIAQLRHTDWSGNPP
jgi:hypothetical protein